MFLYYYFGAKHKEFDKLGKRTEFEIPGLKENFVPQGLEYISKLDKFLVSGYMSDGTPSRIYMVDNKTKQTEKYITLKKGCEPYKGHCGGVATNGEFLWVAGDKKLETISLSDIIKAKNQDVVEIKHTTITGNGCDFVSVYKNHLIVGEFYRKDKYETPKTHHITHSLKEETKALAFCYKISNNISGVEENPSFLIALPNNTQGLCFVGNGDSEKVLVSTSWSIPKSRLFLYYSPFVKKNNSTTLMINGIECVVYNLTKNNLSKIIKAPAMSEEVISVKQRVYIMFESACKKYRRINRTRTKNCLSIKI